MKRALFGDIQVIPAGGGDSGVIDRKGYISLRLGGIKDTAGSVTVTVKDCDTATGTFAVVDDTQLFPGYAPTTAGVCTLTVPADVVINLNIDILGCKQFITVSTTFDDVAVVLGDATYQDTTGV